jgi:diguanylate cyclase (GGDEF)-like protein
MEERLKELGFAREPSLPVSLIFIDVDKLKAVNDKFGHVAGDLYLRQIAKTIRATVRKSDTVGRLGGDEFIVIMPKTDCEAGQEVAALVQENCLAEISFGKSGHGSISFGVAVREAESQTIEEIRMEAEEKMYEQKKAKRHRR